MKDDEKIINIRYGELQIYYPMKFDTNSSYERICNKIEKSSFFYSEKYQKSKQNEMDCLAKKFIDEMNELMPEDCAIRWKTSGIIEGFDIKKEEAEVEDLYYEIDETGELPKIKIANQKLEVLDERVERMVHEYEFAMRYYGKSYVYRQQRFLLLPFKAILKDGQVVYIQVVLYVFSNGMALLKFELPLKNMETQFFKDNNLEEYFSQIQISWNKEIHKELKWNELVKFYCNQIHKETGLNIWQYTFQFQNIILVDFDGIPQSANALSNAFQEELFRIICAPVPERSSTSFEKDAKEYIRKYAWGEHDIKYVIGTKGECLSFLDKKLLEYQTEEYKKLEGCENLEEKDYDIVYNRLVRDIQMNAELAFVIILLKKMNQSNDYNQKKVLGKELSKIKKEFWENTIFICELQETSYGSVLEQISDFENMMPHFIKQESTEIKILALDNIQQENERQSTEKFQKFITIVGLFLTLVFGLSSIRDTLQIIRTTCTFISKDIPGITLDNASVGLWVLLNGIILLKLIGGKVTFKYKK